MKINSFPYTLKDGRASIIRSPREEDAQEMLNFLNAAASETDFIIRSPEDAEITLDGERAFLQGLIASDCVTMLVCEVEGRVAGNCEIRWNNKLKTRHRATVGIALRKEYWNQGIGTRFFQELIRIAEDRPELLQIELEFIEGNARARALYEKMGFRVTGILPNAVRLKDGTLLNTYQMIRELRR